MCLRYIVTSSVSSIGCLLREEGDKTRTKYTTASTLQMIPHEILIATLSPFLCNKNISMYLIKPFGISHN